MSKDVSGNDELFFGVLKRWRELGGHVARPGSPTVVLDLVEAKDDLTLRGADWLYLALGEDTKANLEVFRCPSACVLKASACERDGFPGKKGIDSWGDWEIQVDRIEKTETCSSVLDLAMRELAEEDWDEFKDVRTIDGIEENRAACMLEACAVMRPLEASWDAVLDSMADNLDEAMFGAEGTVPQHAATFQSDGNTQEVSN
eukprot:gene6256-6075_t